MEPHLFEMRGEWNKPLPKNKWLLSYEARDRKRYLGFSQFPVVTYASRPQFMLQDEQQIKTAEILGHHYFLL